jgi:hypothetical protein
MKMSLRLQSIDSLGLGRNHYLSLLESLLECIEMFRATLKISGSDSALTREMGHLLGSVEMEVMQLNGKQPAGLAKELHRRRLEFFSQNAFRLAGASPRMSDNLWTVGSQLWALSLASRELVQPRVLGGNPAHSAAA